MPLLKRRKKLKEFKQHNHFVRHMFENVTRANENGNQVFTRDHVRLKLKRSLSVDSVQRESFE